MDIKTKLIEPINTTPAAGANRCGALQLFAWLLIVGVISGSIIYSTKTEGYDTSDYNWVDSWRVGIARFMGCLLFMIYSTTALFNHTNFVDVTQLAKPAFVEGLPSAQEIWESTPTASRGAAISCGGWCVCYAILIFCMTFFEPGCGRGLLITIIIIMVYWQIVWYGGMYGRIDADDSNKLPLSNFFKNETIMEIIIAALCCCFVFFTDGTAKRVEVEINPWRVWSIRFMGALMLALYGSSILLNHTAFVGQFATWAVVEGGPEPAEIWRRTPTQAKFAAVEGAGWNNCWAITALAMTFLEPGCEKGICKSFALAFVWWNCVWYAGMWERIDFNDPIKRPWTLWFKNESIQEIILFCLMGYLGFVAK